CGFPRIEASRPQKTEPAGASAAKSTSALLDIRQLVQDRACALKKWRFSRFVWSRAFKGRGRPDCPPSGYLQLSPACKEVYHESFFSPNTHYFHSLLSCCLCGYGRGLS